MKPNQLFTSMLAVTALFVASCSTSKLAQNSAIQDDVYNTTAQAKEYKEVAQPQATAQNNTQVDDYYGTSDPYYDMDYSTRINRFYYANPWRTYYDGYYGYNSYSFNPFFDSYAFGFGMGMYGGLNNWLSPYSYWGLYGSPYYSNYWGPYSYNNYYGGGYGGGGYYGSIGRGVGSNANYGPRPSRGSENGVNRANGTSYNGNPNGIASRTSSGSGSRAERYNPSNGASTTGTRTNGTTSSTPNRSSGSDSRPTRQNDAPPPRTYSPPPPSSPPPSSSSSGSSSRSGGGSSSSSGSGGGGRPTRGGGR